MSARTLGPVVLTTRTLGGATGVSQVALDIALALSLHCSELRIRAWVPTCLPAEVDGHPLERCVWDPLSPLTAVRAMVAKEAPPRALLEHTLRARAWLRTLRSSRPSPVLEVVNGLGAHALSMSKVAGPQLRGAPRWLVVHESPRHFDEPGRFDISDALHAIRSYDYRVYVSQRGRQEWDALAGLDTSRSFWIPNCVREQHVARVRSRSKRAVREALGVADDCVYVVCVGQVSPRKGQDVLLDALDELGLSAAPLYLELLGDCSSAWAQQLLQRTPASAARVRFAGQVSDVYERVYAADLLVLGSRAEASPLVVLEAMALGTCVVAADVDGVAEQVADEKSGLLFPREDVRGLAERLERLLRDTAARQRLAAAGQARYLERYSRAQQLAHWGAALSGA